MKVLVVLFLVLHPVYASPSHWGGSDTLVLLDLDDPSSNPLDILSDDVIRTPSNVVALTVLAYFNPPLSLIAALLLFGKTVSAAPDTWSVKSPMPTPRLFPCVFTTPSHMHVAGGILPTGVVKMHERYEVAADTWVTLSPLPLPMDGAGAAVGSDGFFVGYDNDPTYKYTLALDTWVAVNTKPTARVFFGLGQTSTDLFAISGGSSVVTEKYVVASDTWVTVASIPSARQQVSVASFGSNVYIAGGMNGPIVTKLEIYNAVTDTWKSGAPVPSLRRGCVAAATSTDLFVASGYAGTFITKHEKYAINTDTWVTVTSSPTGRYAMGVGVIGGAFFVVGGGDPQRTAVERYEMMYPPMSPSPVMPMSPSPVMPMTPTPTMPMTPTPTMPATAAPTPPPTPAPTTPAPTPSPTTPAPTPAPTPPPVDECATNTHDCSPDGYCTDTPSSFTCACNAGFSGDGRTCTDINECAITPSVCHAKADCVNSVGSHTCTCWPGYYDGSGGQGLACSDLNECTLGTHNCDANAVCTNVGGSFYCTCSPGFADASTGAPGTVCVDHDECEAGTHNCSTNAVCVNDIGTHNCACNFGWQGDGNVCGDIDECATSTHSCNTFASCENTQGSHICNCFPGFVHPSGEEFLCVDVNECVEGTHTCSPVAACSNLPGSFACTCNTGYSGDGFSCTDVDECLAGTHNCHASASCANAIGSFTCTCNPGFTGDGVTCVDNNECSAGTHNCVPPLVCNNIPGSFQCGSLGCDGLFESGTTYDSCGICGGDHSACTGVSPTMIMEVVPPPDLVGANVLGPLADLLVFPLASIVFTLVTTPLPSGEVVETYTFNVHSVPGLVVAYQNAPERLQALAVNGLELAVLFIRRVTIPSLSFDVALPRAIEGVWAAGQYNGNSVIEVLDGSSDCNGFSVDSLNKPVRALQLYQNTIYAAGDFSRTASGKPVSRVVYRDVFTGDWASVGEARFDASVNALVVHEQRMVAGGLFSRVGSIESPGVALWNGWEWSGMGGGLAGPVFALASHGGFLFAGGAFKASAKAGPRLSVRGCAVWDEAFDVWRPVGGGVSGEVYAMIVDDFSIFVAGKFRRAGGTFESEAGGYSVPVVEVSNVARYDIASAQWTALQGPRSGTDGPVLSLASLGIASPIFSSDTPTTTPLPGYTPSPVAPSSVFINETFAVGAYAYSVVMGGSFKFVYRDGEPIASPGIARYQVSPRPPVAVTDPSTHYLSNSLVLRQTAFPVADGVTSLSVDLGERLWVGTSMGLQFVADAATYHMAHEQMDLGTYSTAQLNVANCTVIQSVTAMIPAIVVPTA